MNKKETKNIKKVNQWKFIDGRTYAQVTNSDRIFQLDDEVSVEFCDGAAIFTPQRKSTEKQIAHEYFLVGVFEGFRGDIEQVRGWVRTAWRIKGKIEVNRVFESKFIFLFPKLLDAKNT